MLLSLPRLHDGSPPAVAQWHSGLPGWLAPPEGEVVPCAATDAVHGERLGGLGDLLNGQGRRDKAGGAGQGEAGQGGAGGQG